MATTQESRFCGGDKGLGLDLGKRGHTLGNTLVIGTEVTGWDWASCRAG